MSEMSDMYDMEPDADERGVKCKRCGRDGFVWEKQEHGWRLVTVGGKIHRCQGTPPNEAFKEFIK